MHSTSYILRYILVVTAVPAVILAFMFTSLKPIHDSNEAIYNRKQIISSLNGPLDIKAEKLSDAEINTYFDKVEQLAVNSTGEKITPIDKNGKEVKPEKIDMEKEDKKSASDRQYPVFIYNDNGKKYYILTVRGKGLWDKIWGWIAIEGDLNTVAGAAFGHKGETPGLGAEIKDNPTWKAQFAGEKLYNDKGDFMSVSVVKGGTSPANKHGVDGITGATITCDGVSVMLKSGIKAYQPYLKTLK